MQHEAVIGIHHNTNAKILADRTALLNSRNTHEESKITLAERNALVDSIMDRGRQFLTVGRDNLKAHLGNEHSQRWIGTGLVRSLVIPRNAALVHPLLDSFEAYYGAHPAYQIAALNLTAVHAGELSADLLAAMGAMNQQENEVSRLKGIRDVNAEKLLQRLRGLRDELGQLIEPLDPLWKAFGFNVPGADETPEVVLGLQATLIGPTVAALKWEAASRAFFYHVFKRVQGIDTEFILVGSPADLDFNLEGLPANATIDIVVAAVNSGGEGQRSEAVTIVTH